MIRVRIQIEDGEVEDSYRKWGFIFVDCDRRTAPPEKKRDATSYAEEPGEHADRRVVDDAFDYEVKFCVVAPNKDLKNANARIAAFNEAIRKEYSITDGEGNKIPHTDIKTCREITLYNDWMRVKITGIPERIEMPTEFHRRQDKSQMDCAVFSLKIHVEDPRKCDFNLKNNK